MKRPLTKRRKILLFIAALFLLDAVLGLFWWQGSQESRFDSEILKAAQQYKVNPALVKAVIWKESRFRPHALGTVGERGLMQIRDLTAQEWCRDNRISGYHSDHLFNPQTNIYIGTWYLGKLLKRYSRTDNPLPYALCDYNAGRTKVLQWASGSASTNSAHFIDQITYPSTKIYVHKVTKQVKKYEHQSWKRSGFLGF